MAIALFQPVCEKQIARGEKGFAYPQFSLVIEGKKRFNLCYYKLLGMLKSLLNERFFFPLCSAQSN